MSDKDSLLISTGTLTREALAGQVAIVTGGGGGIGFEAARALCWLGAHVVLAEIDKRAGQEAAIRLAQEFGMHAAGTSAAGADVVTFVPTDVGSERSVGRLARRVLRERGRVDIVLNNATIAPLGAVQDVPIAAWDASYRVNLRGPVLLARAFLPGMLQRNRGVFVSVSSYGLAYMGAYEILKHAQVELASTLDAELEQTGVIAFTIGPGAVPTATMRAAIPRLAEMYGKTTDEFYAMLEGQTLSVEAAGAGFAAAIALAERYRGQETSSIQALMDAGISLPAKEQELVGGVLTPEKLEQVAALARRVRQTLAEQVESWQERPLFEQQWMKRAFRKQANLPAERWLEQLEKLEQAAAQGDAAATRAVVRSPNTPLPYLARFYAFLYGTAEGYIRDPQQREEYLAVIRGWQEEVDKLEEMLA